ncbi:MAG: ABC transporter permease [Bacteroidota bacterium]
MFTNYLKIAFRNMVKAKGYSFINIAGLTIGVVVCFLLFLWIKDELSYDQFHKNADRIYRSLWEAKYGDNSWKIPQVPMPLAGALEREFPEVELATQVYEGRFTVKKDGAFVRENNVLFIDEKFFDVFSIELLAGELKKSINNPNAIIITEKTAERYFVEKNNYENIIGKNISRNDGQELQILGVVKSFPVQSHLQFDFLASINQLSNLERRKTQWSSASVLTYFLLDKNGDPNILSEKLQAFVDENLTDKEFLESGNYTRFPFESITEIHVKPNLSYIWMFGVIAMFILILACINFINLTTARAMTRAREVGVRKVLGSKRWQLVQQFFTESTIYVLLAVVLAVLLAEIALPYFNAFTDKNLMIDLQGAPFVWGLLLSLIIGIALLTGVFPALALSSFMPVKVLKGALIKSSGKDRLRQGLVIFQFCISCVLIIGTLVVKDQLHFLQNKNMGFDKEQVLIVRTAYGLRENFDPFLQKLRANPTVERVSTAQYLPGDGFDSTIFVPEQPANYEQTSLSYCHVDEHFVKAMKLQLVAGRNFDLSFSTDSTACIINETAAKRLGWDDPIGKNLSYGGYIDSKVVGVVKDFNFTSLHEEIEPLVLRMSRNKSRNIFLRLQSGNLNEQVAFVQGEWKALAPEVPFEFTFLDDQIQQLYDSEKRMSSIFSVFAFVAIFIACLGLLGLASFMTAQRTKEIGIRKVLGASVSSVVGLLTREFVFLVGLGLLMAAPIAWYLMNQWLAEFAYRINISWSVFALAAAAVVIVAFFTVSFQSVKAALANPVDSLKTE